MQLYTQTDITKSNTGTLQEITLKELRKIIISDELKGSIQSMRKVKSLSLDSYGFIKRKLPYFIGAKFKNNIRNSSNFEQINYFVIDVDKYGTYTETERLKKRICEDTRVVLAFISPGGDGLKIVYSLENAIQSLKKYSDFYKAFVMKLALQFQLEKTIDYSTSDATRICFLSYDEKVYINYNAEKVNADIYIPEFDLLQHTELFPENLKEKETKEQSKEMISNKQYKAILEKLNPKTPKPQKKYIVPEILNIVSEMLVKEFKKNNLYIDCISDINYGKKVIVKDGNLFASYNIFYGRKGFSVVKTPVRNSNEDLLEICVRITENLLYSNIITPHLARENHEENDEKPACIFNRIDKENKAGRIIRLQAAR